MPLPRTPDTTGQATDFQGPIRLRDGVRVGLLVTRAVVIYCVVLFCVAAVVTLVRSPSSFPEDLANANANVFTFPLLVGGYLVAFCLAGVAWAWLSRLPR